MCLCMLYKELIVEYVLYYITYYIYNHAYFVKPSEASETATEVTYHFYYDDDDDDYLQHQVTWERKENPILFSTSIILHLLFLLSALVVFCQHLQKNSKVLITRPDYTNHGWVMSQIINCICVRTIYCTCKFFKHYKGIIPEISMNLLILNYF